MRISKIKERGSFIDTFIVSPGQAWCVFGTAHSGIHEFFRLVTGETAEPAVDVVLTLPSPAGIVSLKKQQAVFESELEKDDTDFMDRIDPGTPAREFIKDPGKHQDLIESFGLTHCLDLGYRQLSTGQTRKLAILAEWSRGPACLIIESPLDGLDSSSRREMDRALRHLHQSGTALVLFICNRSDIPSWCTHLAVMADGRLKHQGPRQAGMDQTDREMTGLSPDFQPCVQDLWDTKLQSDPVPDENCLVRLRQGRAGYGGKTVFEGLDLCITKGCHTLVTGPNGCGKSTLLQVITGDHPACYQSDLTLFGIRRGSGESIWDLKKHIGLVSAELHRNYRTPGSALSCVLSGFFDSIGVYRIPSPDRIARAMTWLDRMGMTQKAQTLFRDLSFSDQRLLLIARALIKAPRLLVLDEPAQGLDEANRKALLDFLGEVAGQGISTLLYVSHREDEFREFFRQHIRMS